MRCKGRGVRRKAEQENGDEPHVDQHRVHRGVYPADESQPLEVCF